MSFKIGLSSNPGKDRGKAEAAMKGDQNFKDALKEVLSEIGQCFENAQLIDVRCKEKAGDVKFEEEKRKAMEGNADVKALARALGFEVEDDEDDDDDYYGKKAEEPTADSGDDDDTSFSFEDDDEEKDSKGEADTSFSFDGDEDDDSDSDSADSTFNFDDDSDDEDGGDFNFDDLDDD